MKFCRNLQRVIDITDPEWAPYWTNYKMLKKFLKTLPSCVPPDGCAIAESSGGAASASAGGITGASPSQRSESPDSDVSDSDGDGADIMHNVAGDDNDDAAEEDHDDEKSQDETSQDDEQDKANEAAITKSAQLTSSALKNDIATKNESSVKTTRPRRTAAAQMSRNPGEVAFFRLLNSELKKAIHFFEKAQLEFEIREARVREGIDIMRKANSLMVSEKWSLMAKSLYRLYKDLLLLETYAIMTYCSFSKILKKHDVSSYLGLLARVAYLQIVSAYPSIVFCCSNHCRKLPNTIPGLHS
jgi:hypothetical protein